jgi:hypothetical protein
LSAVLVCKNINPSRAGALPSYVPQLVVIVHDKGSNRIEYWDSERFLHFLNNGRMLGGQGYEVFGQLEDFLGERPGGGERV